MRYKEISDFSQKVRKTGGNRITGRIVSHWARVGGPVRRSEKVIQIYLDDWVFFDGVPITLFGSALNLLI